MWLTYLTNIFQISIILKDIVVDTGATVLKIPGLLSDLVKLAFQQKKKKVESKQVKNKYFVIATINEVIMGLILNNNLNKSADFRWSIQRNPF